MSKTKVEEFKQSMRDAKLEAKVKAYLLRLTDTDMTRLGALMLKWECSRADVFRRSLRESFAKEGLKVSNYETRKT